MTRAILVFVTLSVSVTGCTSSTSDATSSARDTTGSASAEPSPVLDGDRLAQPFTYADATVRFDPLPARYEPTVPASEAMDEFKRSVASALTSSRYTPRPELFLAAYTAVQWRRLPVWVIRLTDVPSFASGAGSTTSSPGPETSQSPSYQDVLLVMGADTGKKLTLYTALPDANQPSDTNESN